VTALDDIALYSGQSAEKIASPLAQFYVDAGHHGKSWPLPGKGQDNWRGLSGASHLVGSGRTEAQPLTFEL
jgi:hypothetical protein